MISGKPFRKTATAAEEARYQGCVETRTYSALERASTASSGNRGRHGCIRLFLVFESHAQSADLTNQISVLKEEQSKLDAIIKQEKIYESRKTEFEKRIQIIEDL